MRDSGNSGFRTCDEFCWKDTVPVMFQYSLQPFWTVVDGMMAFILLPVSRNVVCILES